MKKSTSTSSPGEPERYTLRRNGADKAEEVELAQGLELVASKQARWDPPLPAQMGPAAPAESGSTAPPAGGS